MASEGKQRSLVQSVVGGKFKVELGPFTFRQKNGSHEIREVPFAYVPNLIAKIADMIESYKRYSNNNQVTHD